MKLSIFWTKPFLHWQEIIPCEFIFKLLTSGCVLLTTFSRLYSQIIPHMGNAARNSHVEEHCTMYLTPAFLKMMLVPSVKHLRKQKWFQQTWNKRTHRIFHFPKKHTTGIWFYRLQVQTSSSKLSLKLMYPQFILCLAMVEISMQWILRRDQRSLFVLFYENRDIFPSHFQDQLRCLRSVHCHKWETWLKHSFGLTY